MALIQTVHLSMANFKSAPVVPAVQNDTDRQVKMIVDDFDLTSGMTGKIAFQRSDGTHYEANATLNTSDNSFTADIDQALTQPGRTMVQLKVTDTLTVSTFSFVIFVEQDNSGTVTPQEGIDLVSAVQAAEDAQEAAEDAADRAEQAASMFDEDVQGYVDDWLDDHPEATTTVQDGSLTLNKFANVVNPDQFDGTDSVKLAYAINSLTNGGIVLLGRDYTLTNNVIITRNSNNGRVIVRPINGTATINCGAYEFSGEGVSDGRRGGISFEDIRFIGSGNLIDGYHLVRMFFRNCYMSGFETLVYNDRTEYARYLQTIYFDSCIIRQISGYIIDASRIDNSHVRIYDVRIRGCIIEWSHGVVRGGWWFGLYVIGNAIEGFDGEAPLFCEAPISNSCVIRDNYFEKNVATTIDLTSYSIGNSYNIDISDNYFVEDTKTDGQVIALPLRNPSDGIVNIKGNMILLPVTTSAYGLYVSDGTTNILTNINVEGNRATVYDPNGKLSNTKSLNQLYDSELFKIKNVVDQTPGNTKSLFLPIILSALTTSIARGIINFPFITKDTNYNISITQINVNDLGNVTSDTSIYSKQTGGFIINVTGTFTIRTNYVGILTCVITFS